MKISRRQLRKIIKDAFDPMEHEHLADEIESIRTGYHDYDERDLRRSMGLLTRGESKKEKSIVHRYNEQNRVELFKFKRELSKPLSSAVITALHAPDYEGAVTSNKPQVSRSGAGPKGWIARYGLSGNVDMSTILVPRPASKLLSIRDTDMNFDMVTGATYAFMMSGYPKLINSTDMMTQTMSSLPPELVDYQRHSGQTKSTAVMPDIINLEGFLDADQVADEAILDNWHIKGVMTVTNDLTKWDAERLADNENYVDITTSSLNLVRSDCQELGLPLYVYYTHYDAVAGSTFRLEIL
jgi:hypothetical protein